MTTADGNNVRFGFLNASFMKHENYSINLLFKRENFIGRSGEIYHYTSIEGFKGIIESGGFWASDNRFLNDSEEMNHGINLVVHIIRHRLRRTKIPAFCHILERTCDSIARPNGASSLVACFSKERDDLGQWRGYAGPGGLCIKLREPRKNERPVFYFPHQAPFVVKYRNRSKAVSILSIINRFEREYMADQTAMPNQWPYLHDEDYYDFLVKAISIHIVTMKNKSFANEEEVRLAIPYDRTDEYGGLRFRTSPIGLIPYICTGDQKGLNGPLPIEEVMVGPSSRQELLADTVRNFLKYKGYSEVEVSLSQVPFRG